MPSDDPREDRRRTVGGVFSGSAASDTPKSPDEATRPGEAAVVVAGRVGTWDDADRVRGALLADGFATEDVEVFYTGPSGRHAQTPIGGDSHADAGATQAGTGATLGGLTGSAAGLAIGAAIATAPVAAPVVFTAAAVGAFGGALAGGVAATEDGSGKRDTEEHPVAKPAGVVVAIRADRRDQGERRAIDTLCANGAIGIERARDARWREGAWADWDPSAPYEQIDAAPGTPQAGAGTAGT